MQRGKHFNCEVECPILADSGQFILSRCRRDLAIPTKARHYYGHGSRRQREQTNLNADYLKNVFRGLHIVWAILGAGICILLASAKGGHPPGLVFVPVAAVIWLTGHVVLWVSRKLAIRGRHLAENRNIAPGKWPLPIILLVLLFGIVFFFGLFGIVWQVLFERDWLRELAVPLAFWVPSSLCFFGILLRQDWSRILAGSGFMVVAGVLLYEMIASFTRGYRNSTTEWVMVIVIFILLTLFGYYILRSSSIKAYYSKRR